MARRRGSAALGMVLALVVLQLVVVGVLLGGSRDHDLTVMRVEGTRAFYAADAGLAMGLREQMEGVDEDGDGGIGSISDDGDAGNDPDLGLARVFVEVDEGGGLSTLTAEGRSGAARSEQSLVLESP